MSENVFTSGEAALGYLKQIDQDPTGEARDRWIGFQKYLIELIILVFKNVVGFFTRSGL